MKIKALVGVPPLVASHLGHHTKLPRVAEDLAIDGGCGDEVINVRYYSDSGKCGLCQHVIIEQTRTACCCYTTRRYCLL
jgi:hypothetical protein